MVVEFLHLKVLFQNYLKESREAGREGKGEKEEERNESKATKLARLKRAGKQEGYQVRYKPEVRQITKEWCGTSKECPKPSAESVNATYGISGTTEGAW